MRAKPAVPMTPEQQEWTVSIVRLAYREAIRCHQRTRIDLDGLQSEALLAICDVGRLFDPELGFALTSYATTAIRRRLWRYCREQMERTGREVSMSTLAGEDGDGKHIEPVQRQERDTSWAPGVIARLRKKVTPMEWAILWLHYAEGVPYREIGVRLGLSTSRICQRDAAARQKLRRSDLRRAGIQEEL